MRTADKGKRREGKLNSKAMFTKIYFNLGFVTESIRKYVHAKSYVYKVVADQIHNVYLMVKTFIRNGTHTYKKNTTQQSSIFVEEGLLMFFFFFFLSYWNLNYFMGNSGHHNENKPRKTLSLWSKTKL